MNSISQEVMHARAHETVERKRRLLVVFVAFPGIIGILSLVVLSFLSDELYGRGVNIPITFVAVCMLAISGVAAAFTYLQTGFRSSKKNELAIELGRLSANDATIANPAALTDEVLNLRSEIESLRNQVTPLSVETQEQIAAKIRSSLLDCSASDLAKETQALVSSKIAASLKSDLTHECFEKCRQRLLLEIDALGRRGNLNLGVGAGITLLGVAILATTVFYEPYMASDVIGLISHYVPRLSLIILIEIFAYFFLGLYRAGLSEIKYFQNEVTNIEAKQIALQASLEVGDNAILSNVVSRLSETERNHILTNDQTTVEIEKAKLESEHKVAFGKFVTDFFQKVKPST